jgi:hypothetical protein
MKTAARAASISKRTSLNLDFTNKANEAELLGFELPQPCIESPGVAFNLANLSLNLDRYRDVSFSRN